jgi:hypothetical protein
MPAEVGQFYWVGHLFRTAWGQPAVVSSRIIDGRPDLITGALYPVLDMLALTYGFYDPQEDEEPEEDSDCASCPYHVPLVDEEE